MVSPEAGQRANEGEREGCLRDTGTWRWLGAIRYSVHKAISLLCACTRCEHSRGPIHGGDDVVFRVGPGADRVVLERSRFSFFVVRVPVAIARLLTSFLLLAGDIARQADRELGCSGTRCRRPSRRMRSVPCVRERLGGALYACGGMSRISRCLPAM